MTIEFKHSSSDTDRGPIWLNLDWTRLAGVDRPGLTVTHVNGVNLLSVHSVVVVVVYTRRSGSVQIQPDRPPISVRARIGSNSISNILSNVERVLIVKLLGIYLMDSGTHLVCLNMFSSLLKFVIKGCTCCVSLRRWACCVTVLL